MRSSILLGVILLIPVASADAQLLNTSPVQQNLQSGFFESNSIGWNLRGSQWFANFGGGGPVVPPFAPAGAGAGAGLRGGFGFGGDVSGGLGFQFAQGSNRSISSTAGSVTTMDGSPGSFQAGVVRPFVTGVTPILRDYPTLVEPSEVAAQVGRSQLSALRQSQAARMSKKLDQYLHRAELAESEGNKRMARANYRGAIAIAPEPLRTQIRIRLQQAMRSKPQKK